MKLYLKYVLVVLMFISLFLLWIPNTVNAGDFSNIIKGGTAFFDRGDGSIIDTTRLQEASRSIYNILFGIAIILAIVTGMVLGIKFIIGSIDEQAKIKEALVPYIISCIVIFGAFTIWEIVVNLGDDIEYEIRQEVGDTDKNIITREDVKNEKIEEYLKKYGKRWSKTGMVNRKG